MLWWSTRYVESYCEVSKPVSYVNAIYICTCTHFKIFPWDFLAMLFLLLKVTLFCNTHIESLSVTQYCCSHSMFCFFTHHIYMIVFRIIKFRIFQDHSHIAIIQHLVLFAIWKLSELQKKKRLNAIKKVTFCKFCDTWIKMNIWYCTCLQFDYSHDDKLAKYEI